MPEASAPLSPTSLCRQHAEALTGPDAFVLGRDQQSRAEGQDAVPLAYAHEVLAYPSTPVNRR